MAASTLSEKQRIKILNKVSEVVTRKFYDPQLHQIDWLAAVKKHRNDIVAAPSDEAFESEITKLLSELKSSHVGFYHVGLARATSKMAICATYAAFPFEQGECWVFQDVHEGGPAAKAGIKSGDILISVEGRLFFPPEHPTFAMGKTATVKVLTSGLREDERVIVVPTPKRKFNQLPYVQPDPVVSHRWLNRDIGYIKISMYPGVVGVEVANEISNAVKSLNPIERMIIDLRGNTGGGIGVLRVMSLLTPAQLPVGTFLSGKLVQASGLEHQPLVFDRIPSRKLGLFPIALKFIGSSLVRKAMGRKTPITVVTEDSEVQPFQGRVVLLVDRHTASANEMLIAFARENKLATILGEATPGRVLGGSKFKMPQGYWLALPVGAYQTRTGNSIEGTPIPPDVLQPFDPESAREGNDTQLERAIEVVSKLQQTYTFK
jgi:carboxyl-terminal processing protease